MKKIIKIEGMSCNHCVNAVKGALEALEGVSRVEVELDKNQALVEGENLRENLLKETIEDIGYDVIEII